MPARTCDVHSWFYPKSMFSTRETCCLSLSVSAKFCFFRPPCFLAYAERITYVARRGAHHFQKKGRFQHRVAIRIQIGLPFWRRVVRATSLEGGTKRVLCNVRASRFTRALALGLAGTQDLIENFHSCDGVAAK